MNTPNGLLLSWDAVTDTSCAESPVKYNVTVVQHNDGTVITTLPDLDINGTEVNITTPSIDYNVFISAKTSVASCDGQYATVLCNKSVADKSAGKII